MHIFLLILFQPLYWSDGENEKPSGLCGSFELHHGVIIQWGDRVNGPPRMDNFGVHVLLESCKGSTVDLLVSLPISRSGLRTWQNCKWMSREARKKSNTLDGQLQTETGWGVLFCALSFTKLKCAHILILKMKTWEADGSKTFLWNAFSKIGSNQASLTNAVQNIFVSPVWNLCKNPTVFVPEWLSMSSLTLEKLRN